MIDINAIYNNLLEHYGSQGWWPLLRKINGIWVSDYSISNLTKPKNREQIFEICLGAILTQNCSWKNVEKALVLLKENNAFSIEYILNVEEAKIIEMIRSSGYYNQKLKKIIFFCKYIDGVFNNKYDICREGLLSVWGIGPETADDILLYAFDIDTFVIDLYTKRILSRIGFCNIDISYNELKSKIEDTLTVDTQIANETECYTSKVVLYKQLHALFVEHAKKFCRKKPICNECILKECCKKRM